MSRSDRDTKQPRPARVHRETAREAGLGTVSPLSIVAGTLCAYGAFAIVAAIVGTLLSGTDLETDFRTNDWTSSGAAAGLITALVLAGAYLFGGYVAGRMARRAGMLHGLGVFVLSLVLGAVVGAIASLGDGVDVAENLRSIGVPTDWDQVEGVAVGAAIASLAAMLLGSLGGGILGERWHTKLVRRFEDPAYGPAAEARRRAEREDEAHHDRRGADPAVAVESGRHGYFGDRDVTDAERDRRREERHERDAEPATASARDGGGIDRDDPRYMAGYRDAVAEHEQRMATERETIDLRDRAPQSDREPASRVEDEVPASRRDR